MIKGRGWVFRLALIVGLAFSVSLAAYLVGASFPTLHEYNSARAALERYDYETARTHVNNHLSAFPADYSAHRLAAEIARRRNEIEEAKSHLARAESYGAAPKDLAFERDLLTLQSGDLSGVDRWIQRCKTKPQAPESALTIEAIFEGSLRTARPDLANGAVTLWLGYRRSPLDQAHGLVWRGRLKMLLNAGFPTVFSDFEEAVEQAPDHPGARQWLTTLLLDQDPSRARHHLDWLRQRQGETPNVRLLSAKLHRNLGQPEKAASILDELIVLEPDNMIFILERGKTAMDLNQLGQAEQWLLRVHTQMPNQRDVNVALANCFRRSGQLAKASQYQEKVRAIEMELDRLQSERNEKAGF